MFVLGFITVSALMLWGIITYITWRQNDAVLQRDIYFWLVTGVVFVLGSLANIGLYCWRMARCRRPVRR